MPESDAPQLRVPDLRVAVCPFCRRIFHNEYDGADQHEMVVNFEPLNPVTPGHRLFVPRHHVTRANVDPVIAGYTFEVAARWAGFQHIDFNLITSSGSAATQTVEHLHVHYVPRVPGDDLHLPWTTP